MKLYLKIVVLVFTLFFSNLSVSANESFKCRISRIDRVIDCPELSVQNIEDICRHEIHVLIEYGGPGLSIASENRELAYQECVSSNTFKITHVITKLRPAFSDDTWRPESKDDMAKYRGSFSSSYFIGSRIPKNHSGPLPMKCFGDMFGVFDDHTLKFSSSDYDYMTCQSDWLKD